MKIFDPTRPDINSSVKSNRVRVEQLPRLTPDNKWRIEAMRSYDQPILLWFTRGQGRITIAGVRHGFGPHHAVFLPAGTMHSYEMLGQVFGMSVSFPKESELSLPEAPVHFRFRDVQQQAELTGLIDNLSRELEGDRRGQDRALLAHAGLLSVWLDRQMIEENLHHLVSDATRRLAAAFTSMVEREFRSGRSINDYAARLGVTPTHLTRSCNVACGRPASAILADRLHFEARRMLRDTARPVKDIAKDLGFSSAAYFTRAFQKQTGLTPTEFRRQT
ncbi:Transcriptional regulator, AraC family [Candidatus Rhodobacter oscarellae]|uniref:Transcriptional regulator, AraC family n=1 Tax=Candidatus Rhodobacter oscarellae TaxID=1675527 RepID=A0A0J9E649_9RHOB|nr:AraC family transcriptional regulator [Candidatus Rhodobacter lobularis]KMW57304.1 Transcriptional regulator, AraC family [Candidatus Rhodobacter lobularis]